MKIHVRSVHNIKCMKMGLRNGYTSRYWRRWFISNENCSVVTPCAFFILFNFGFDSTASVSLYCSWWCLLFPRWSTLAVSRRIPQNIISDGSRQSSVSSVVIDSARLCRASPPTKLRCPFEYNTPSTQVILVIN